jgi:hypothetical protein
MVTNAEDNEEVETTKDRAEATLRSAIAGHPQGGVRRIILYLVAYLGVLVTFVAPLPVSFIALTWAMMALTLLCTTDQIL